MYVQRNIEVRLRNHIYRRKAISIAYLCVRAPSWMRVLWSVHSPVCM
jgi:hypothetical protein